MERFRDVFHHPHELVARWGRNHALRHKVANGLCGVAETEREHYRGASDEVFRGERLSLGKLRHDVGKQEGEVAQVLPGQLAMATTIVRPLHSTEALEELQLHALEARAPGSNQLLDFDYRRLEHQLGAFLGP